MIEMFRQAGFKVELGEVRRWEAMPTNRFWLSKEFRERSDKELMVSGFDVILRKIAEQS